MLLLREQHLHLVSGIQLLQPEVHSYVLDLQAPIPSDHLQSEQRTTLQAELPLAQQTPTTSEPDHPSDTDSFATCRSTLSRESSHPTNPHRRRPNLWKTTNPPKESSAAPRPSTPDMSVFIEPLTPPATSPNVGPTRTWSVATHPPVALQRQYEGTDGSHTGLAPIVERPTERYRVGGQTVPGHLPASNTRTNFNLPPVLHDQYPHTTPPVTHPTHPETSLASLIEQSRARAHAQQTQARMEQFAVCIYHVPLI